MKKLATSFTLFALLFTTILNAQRFSFSESETHIEGDKDNTAFQNPITMYNDSGVELQMQWEVLYEKSVGPMVPTHCDPTLCSPPGTQGRKFTFDTTFQFTDYINVHFYPNGGEGACTSSVIVYEQGDKDNADTLVFYGKTTNYADYLPVLYSVDSSLIESIDDVTTNNSISQNYPNPTSGITRIDFNVNHNLAQPKLIVQDILGSTVYTQNLIANSKFAELNLNLISGIYFYSLWDGNSKIATKKMSVR